MSSWLAAYFDGAQGGRASAETSEQLREGHQPQEDVRRDYPFERRLSDATRLREKHPDRVPVILSRAENSVVPESSKTKFLVPCDLTVGQFVYFVRKNIKLNPEQAIFIFVKNALPPISALMAEVYQNHKEDDGFLYITYSGENTFGGC